MDRYRPNIVRSAAAAAVAVLLVAGGAFAANAVFSPASPVAAPAINLTADDSTATPTTGATVAPDDANRQGADATAGTVELADTAEPNETADVESQQGHDDATAEPAETAEPHAVAPAQTAEPTSEPGDENGSHDGGGDD